MLFDLVKLEICELARAGDISFSLAIRVSDLPSSLGGGVEASALHLP